MFVLGKSNEDNRGRLVLSQRYIAVALFVVTVLLYLRVVGFDFITFDDSLYVFSNRHVVTGLEWQNVQWAFSAESAGESANWHPLTWLSLMPDVELFGITPAGFHGTNVLLHAVNVALLFGVLCRLTGHSLRSACVAGIFAVHPLHVESVVWVAERKDVLSTFWGLAALWFWSGYVHVGHWRSYLLAVFSFALSLLSKQMWVTLPCVLLLLDYWPVQNERTSGRSLLRTGQ